MSDFTVNCPHCESPFEAPQHLIGQDIECPTCQGLVHLLAPESKPKVGLWIAIASFAGLCVVAFALSIILFIVPSEPQPPASPSAESAAPALKDSFQDSGQSPPTPSWSTWEKKHAVSRHEAFLVIKQPGEGFCYVKQSYSDSSKMQLTYSGSSPTIATPYYRGIDGTVEYWIDNGDKRTVPKSAMNGNTGFDLGSGAVSDMKAGRILYVRVNPSARPITTQRFSLRGFSAAVKALSRSECQDKETTPASANLEVKLTRQSDGGVTAFGDTSLPDGMELMVSIRSSGGDYFAQDQIRVRSGSYRSSVFTDQGKPLPPGKYRVSISSPLMDLQPPQIQEKLGASGREIPKDIREKSPFGDTDTYTVDYSVSRTLE